MLCFLDSVSTPWCTGSTLHYEISGIMERGCHDNTLVKRISSILSLPPTTSTLSTSIPWLSHTTRIVEGERFWMPHYAASTEHKNNITPCWLNVQVLTVKPVEFNPPSYCILRQHWLTDLAIQMFRHFSVSSIHEPNTVLKLKLHMSIIHKMSKN